MSEDVTSQMKLAITLSLVAACLGIVVNLTTTWLAVLNEFRGDYVAAVNQSSVSSISSLQNFSSIEASNIYKTLLESDAVSYVHVTLLDTTELEFDFTDPDVDPTWFIENAIKRFKVTVEVRSGYELYLEEVDIN